MKNLVSEPNRRRASSARLAIRALREELVTWPKPGLVSPRDSGSHDDMNAELFEASIAALPGYFSEIHTAGLRGAPLADLRELGISAEERMMQATGGVNTHRGAIFSLGLLVAAAGRRAGDAMLAGQSLGRIVRSLWGQAIEQFEAGCGDSHGQTAARRHGAGGARMEAAFGFPRVYDIGLPALRKARHVGWNRAKVQCLFAIIADLDDTNLLHRGGAAGLDFARGRARVFLEAGGVMRPEGLRDAAEAHRQFVARRLSPGGAGDLLAATILVHALDPAVSPEW
jgi:triphosphoribosyl-dephospho-CoA synthase